MTKKLLIGSVVTIGIGLAFVTNLINVQNTVALYVVLPLGAVFLGLYLIFRALEKETALYNQEQQGHPSAQVAGKDCQGNCCCGATGKSATAH
jgi:hypothetical protein